MFGKIAGLVGGLLLGVCVGILFLPEKREPLTIVALTELGVSPSSPVVSIQSAAAAVSQPTLPSLPAALAQPVAALSSVQPELKFPVPKGEFWCYTGGPHAGYEASGVWSAVDFSPDFSLGSGCAPSSARIIAPAPGLISYPYTAAVNLDLDGDGNVSTGWVLFFLHVATEGKVASGTYVQTGDLIGHPSCEGGNTPKALHLHFARFFNGVWVPTDSLVLSGWNFTSTGALYQGLMVKSEESSREAKEGGCWVGVNDIPSDNIATGN